MYTQSTGSTVQGVCRSIRRVSCSDVTLFTTDTTFTGSGIGPGPPQPLESWHGLRRSRLSYVGYICCLTEICTTPLKHSSHFRHHKFKIQQFYFLASQCIHVLCMDLKTNGGFYLYTALNYGVL